MFNKFGVAFRIGTFSYYSEGKAHGFDMITLCDDEKINSLLWILNLFSKKLSAK